MWPPTNAAVGQGMMSLLPEPDAIGPHGERIYRDYLGSQCQLVAIASEFPATEDGEQTFIPGKLQNWGPGAGQWTVNYQQVSSMFWSLMETYAPAALLTFSRWTNSNEWCFETLVRNMEQSGWVNHPTFLGEPYAGMPFAGGSPDDPAAAPGRPNFGSQPALGGPPDAAFPAWAGSDTAENVRSVSEDSLAFMQRVAARLQAELVGIEPTYGTNAGLTEQGNIFVSAFLAYHAVWYQSVAASTCKLGFHTHVGFNLPLETCGRALKIQLAEAIQTLSGGAFSPR